jgi:hypothetical protein
VAPGDHLVTTATAQDAEFSPGPCVNTNEPPGTICEVSNQLGQISEAWRHRMSRSESVTAGAGVAGAAVRLFPGAPTLLGAYPVLDASYTAAFARGAQVAVFARLAPYMDLITASILNTVSAEVRVLYPIGPLLTVHLGASGSQSLPATDPTAITAARGEVGVNYLLSKRVDVGFGERWLWQENALGANLANTGGAGSAPSLATAYGYLAVTVRVRALHF